MFNGRGPAYPYLGFLVQTPWVKSQFLWIDENGDGLVQESEIRFYSARGFGQLLLSPGRWRAASAPT